MKKACCHIACLASFLLTAFPAFSQNSTSFKKIDSIALTVKFKGNYITLTDELTSPFYTDREKLRAIYKWVSFNIAYDYRFANSEKEIQVPECADEYNCADIIKNWENNFVKRVLLRRRATDFGYSLLISKICEVAHIQQERIQGYYKNKPYQIGNKIGASHYWNAVLIDTSWLFIDATCGAGYCIENEETGKYTRFVRDNSDYYFLLPFQKMSRNHFPKNEIWGHTHHMSLQEFFKRPHYYTIDILNNISDENPDTGMLTGKKGDTLHFRYSYLKSIKSIQINSNVFRNPSLYTAVTIKGRTKYVRDTWAEKKQVYIPFKKSGNQYSFDYVITDNSLYYVEVIFDNKPALRYKFNNSR